MLATVDRYEQYAQPASREALLCAPADWLCRRTTAYSGRHFAPLLMPLFGWLVKHLTCVT